MQNLGARITTGSVLVETVIILPVLLLITLGAVQFAFIYETKSSLDHATFMSARAGSVEHANKDAIRSGLAKALIPLYSRERTIKSLLKARLRVEADVRLYADISILNPTPEAFSDFAVRNKKNGKHEIPNEMLHQASIKLGRLSEVNIQDANLLKIRVLYGYELKVPLVNKLITAIASRFINSPRKLLMLSQGRLPISSTATVRMQSRAWQNSWMLRAGTR